MKVKIINYSKHELPSYASSGSAGMDLRANIAEDVVLKPRERYLFSTGIHIALPDGYEAQVRSRSGLACKYGIKVTNDPGTIDSDYRGEIKVSLINLSDSPFVIHDGERIAQLVIAKYEKVEWDNTDNLDNTERGDGAFGHTGVN